MSDQDKDQKALPEMPEFTEDSVSKVLVDIGMLCRPWTRTVWKDGIDIEMPSGHTMTLVSEIYRRIAEQKAAPVPGGPLIEQTDSQESPAVESAQAAAPQSEVAGGKLRKACPDCRRKIEAAQRDAMRLDWCEKHQRFPSKTRPITTGGIGRWTCANEVGFIQVEANSAREAIDSAIKASAGKS